MIITGYQGIGKSTLASKNDKIIEHYTIPNKIRDLISNIFVRITNNTITLYLFFF